MVASGDAYDHFIPSPVLRLKPRPRDLRPRRRVIILLPDLKIRGEDSSRLASPLIV